MNNKRKRQFIIRAYRGRAVVAERRKNWEQAESDLRMWLEQDPDNANAHTRLGQVLFMRDEARAGYEEFVTAQQLNEELASPYVSAAVMYTRLGQTAEALRAFEKAFDSDPDDATTLVAYAQALIKARDTSKAESVLSRARSVASDQLNVWLLSGVNARIGGDPATAEQYFLRALALSPSNRDVLNQMSQVLIESTNPEDNARALTFAKLNAQLFQTNPDVNITLSWILFQSGQTVQANTALRQALQGGAMSPDGQFLLAKMLMARNDTENAKKLLQAALEAEGGLFVQKEQAEALLATL